MSAHPTLAPDEIPFSKPRRRWGDALRALRSLLRDKEDTGQVFQIMAALNGGSNARNYERLLSTPKGGRLAYERVELRERLMDAAWLDSFAEGTVGAAYRRFIRSENLSAEGLAEVARQVHGKAEIAHPHAWFGRRTRDIHDLWHVLTGYGRDALGEACVVAFSYAQTGSLGWALIALGAMVRPRHNPVRRPYAWAIFEGCRRGRAARWLLGEDYEALMAEPLDSARARLGIRPAPLYASIPVTERDILSKAHTETAVPPGALAAA